MKQKLYLIFILLLVFSVANAQKSIVKGYVFDKENNTKLVGANVVLTPTNYGDASDNDGYFVIKNVKAGKYQIQVLYLGYKRAEKTINVTSGKEITLNFYLERGSIILSPTEIQVHRKVTFSNTKTKILESALEQEATRDVGDLLRQVPNVSGVRKGGSAIDPVIRGFKFDQLNVILDGGIRVEGGCPNRMDPVSSHVEMEDIKTIEVVKGPYTLRYGPTFGGVINLITKKPKAFNTEKFEIHARAVKGYESNWDGDKEHLQVYGGNNRVYFSLSGSQSRYDDYTDGRGEVISSGFHKWNHSAELGFRPAENQEILLSYNESHGRDVYYSALPMDEREDNTNIMSIDYTAKNLSEKISDIKIKVYRSKVEHIMDNKEKPSGDTVAAISAIDPTNTGGRAEIGLNIGENGKLFIGTDYENIDKDGTRTKNFYAMPPTPIGMPLKVEDIWTNSNIQNNGIFAEYSNRFGTLELITATRIDFNRGTTEDMNIYKFVKGGKDTIQQSIDNVNTNFTNLSFSLGLTKQLNENISVGLGLGRGVRSPGMVERFIRLLPVGYDQYDYLGNPLLEPEANNQADLNIEYTNEDIGGFKVNVFYSYITNFISAKEVPPSYVKQNTSSVLGVKQFYNSQDAVMFNGFEFTYSTPSKFKIGGQVIAAYTQGTMAKSYSKLTTIKNDPVSEIPPFEANIMLHYKMFNDKLIPRFSYRVVAEQNKISESYGEKNTPGFSVANFGLVYKYSKLLTLAGGINNIFDNAYYEHLNRRMLGSHDNIYEPGRAFYINMIVNL